MHYVVTVKVVKLEDPKPAEKDRSGNEEEPATYGKETELANIEAKHSELETVITRVNAHLELVSDF